MSAITAKASRKMKKYAVLTRLFGGNAEQDTLTVPKSQIELLSKRVAINVKLSFNRLSHRC